MSVPTRIFLSAPAVTLADQAAVLEAMQSGWIAPVGPALSAFEAKLAGIVGHPAVCLSSGTAAIHLGLKALGVGPSDLVLVPTLTFAASLNPILYLGAQPILIDVDAETGNIDLACLADCLSQLAKLNKLPKAIIVVDLFGMPAPMAAIRALVRAEYGGAIAILEDAAEAMGSTILNDQNDPVGTSLGQDADLTTWSFNGNKIITTSGGGAISGSSPALLDQVKYWATQARKPVIWYEHQDIGYNYRLSNLLAALGNSQLDRLAHLVAGRREIYSKYQNALNPFGLVGQAELAGSRSNRWLPVFKVPVERLNKSPLSICEHLNSNGIEARPVWKPMHQQPYLQDIVNQQLSLLPQSVWPEADLWFSSGICLPTGPQLSSDLQDEVISAVRKTLS